MGKKPAYDAGVLGTTTSRYNFQSGKGLGIRAEFDSNKVNVPVFRRNLSRIKVSRSARDGAHKDSIKAHLVPGQN
eukprot:1148579-Pelagomonas_calceolata.AAC.11